ncbi:MAG: iron donor protein CyaY [Deltaproteobacteria bacterium]|nr:iron donor protein CyaY [Deltaproteobacteria bacterium]
MHMEEKEYRQVVDQTFKTIERAFDGVDPDVAEFEFSQGAVTILFSDKSRCILSTQPSVRQIWLAAASRGIAHHFDYNGKTSQWVDDKGKGVELTSYLRSLVRESVGVELNL